MSKKPCPFCKDLPKLCDDARAIASAASKIERQVRTRLADVETAKSAEELHRKLVAVMVERGWPMARNAPDIESLLSFLRTSIETAQIAASTCKAEAARFIKSEQDRLLEVLAAEKIKMDQERAGLRDATDAALKWQSARATLMAESSARYRRDQSTIKRQAAEIAKLTDERDALKEETRHALDQALAATRRAAVSELVTKTPSFNAGARPKRGQH